MIKFFFFLKAALIFFASILGSISLHSYSLYSLTPNSCNHQTLRTYLHVTSNISSLPSYYLEEWLFTSFNGYCPSKSIIKTYVGKGLLINYRNCIAYNDEVTWKSIDSKNKVSGHSTNLVEGAKKLMAIEYYLSYIRGFALAGFLMSVIFKLYLRLSIAGSIIFYFLMWICWGAVFLLLSGEISQFRSIAWSTTFYATCQVDIKLGGAYYIGIFNYVF